MNQKEIVVFLFPMEEKIRSHRTGFSLLEVLIAIAVFVTATASIFLALNTGYFVFEDNRKMSLASLIAQSHLEKLNNMLFSEIKDSPGKKDVDYPDFTVAIDVEEKKDPLPVEVKVSWFQRGEELNVSVKTLFSEYRKDF